MKTKFKLLPLATLLFTTVLAIGFGLLAFAIGEIILHKEQSAVAFFLFFIMLSLAVTILLGMTPDIKSLKINDKQLTISFFFGLATYKYALKEIDGYKIGTFQNRIGRYLSLEIKTADNKVFEINGFLIKNIDETKIALANKFNIIQTTGRSLIGTKEKLMLLVTACAIISLLWLIIENL